jgi:hypothetical protein
MAGTDAEIEAIRGEVSDQGQVTVEFPIVPDRATRRVQEHVRSAHEGYMQRPRRYPVRDGGPIKGELEPCFTVRENGQTEPDGHATLPEALASAKREKHYKSAEIFDGRNKVWPR